MYPPLKVSERLRREAAQLAEDANRLHKLVKGGIWLGDPKSLAEVERRIRGAWGAIRTRWSPQDIERQVHNAIEASAAPVTRSDVFQRTREQAVEHAVEWVELIVSDALSVEAIGTARKVDRALIEQAILAHLSPARRGRPRKGAQTISKVDAMANLLHSLGLVSNNVEVPSEAVRKRMSRRARK